MNNSTNQIKDEMRSVFSGEAAEHWLALVNGLSEGMLIIDQSLTVTWANTSAARILRVDLTDLVGTDVRIFDGTVFTRDGRPVPYKQLPLVRSLETGDIHSGIVLMMNLDDGNRLYLRINSRQLGEAKSGQGPLALVTFIDITNQIEFEESLKRSEAKYRIMAEHSTDIISVTGLDSVFRYLSPAVATMLGYRVDELIGKHAMDFVHPEDKERVIAAYKNVFREKSGAVTFRFRNAYGRYQCLENAVKLVTIGNTGEGTELVSISRDVTNRMRMENALRRSEENYRVLFDNASDAIYIHELFGKIIEVNSVATERLGYSKEELTRMTPTDLQRSDFRAEYPSRMSKLLTDNVLVYETIHVRKDGSTYSAELSLRLIDYDGRRMVMSIGRDITDRKRLEEERQRSLDLLHATIESTADGILVISNTSEILTHNSRFEEMWALPPRWKDLYSWEDRIALLVDQVVNPEQFYTQIMKLYETPNEHSYDIIDLKDGRVYERYSIPFKIGEQHLGRSWSFRDITKRREAEMELRQNRAHLKAIFDHAGVAIGLLDTEGKFVLANERWANLFGVSVDEVCDCDPFAFSHPEDVEIGQQHLRAVLDGESNGYRIEKRYVRTDGKLIWGDLLVTPMFDEDGNLESILGVISDITESKMNEEKLQQTNRELQQRNEELDAFAHTVAHDLRNPLGIILGYGNLMVDHKDELSEDEIRSIHIGIMESANKMQEIIESLLLLSQLRSEEIARETVNMEAVVSEALKHVDRLAMERRAEISLPDSWPVCQGYQSWIEEVWANYISNAIKYGGTPPVIELGATAFPDGMVRYWIRDNGNGIDPSQSEKLFNKFVRFTSRARDGQGLGLSIVRRIIEKLGGEVGVDSTVGEGSTFYFTLPSSEISE